MKAKAKGGQSPCWPNSIAARFKSNKEICIVLDDLELNQDNDLALCRQALDAITTDVGEYHAAIKFFKEQPRIANQLAELKRLHKAIKQTYPLCRDLSERARHTVKNARVNKKAHDREEISSQDRTETHRIDQALLCVHADLALLDNILPIAIQNLSVERRGRTPSFEHALIKRLGLRFDQFDQSKHTDNRTRTSARIAFVNHVLKFTGVRAPIRLASILSQQ